MTRCGNNSSTTIPNNKIVCMFTNRICIACVMTTDYGITSIKLFQRRYVASSILTSSAHERRSRACSFHCCLYFFYPFCFLLLFCVHSPSRGCNNTEPLHILCAVYTNEHCNKCLCRFMNFIEPFSKSKFQQLENDVNRNRINFMLLFLRIFFSISILFPHFFKKLFMVNGNGESGNNFDPFKLLVIVTRSSDGS